MAHQRFEPALAPGAHDLDLKVPTAGGASAVIRSLTTRSGTRVCAIEHGETAGRSRQGPGYQPPPIDDPEAVTAELSGLGGPRRFSRRVPRETMGCAVRAPRRILGKVAAGNVDDGITVQLAVGLPWRAEGQPLGMAQEPGCLVVSGTGAVFGGGQAEGDTKRPALLAEPPTWR